VSELYKTSTIQRLTGFTPTVLRAWERRHGLLRPERSDGGHRLYTDDDLRVLLASRTLMEAGRSIGEIAALGRAQLLLVPPEEAPVPEVAAPDLGALAERLVDAAVQMDPGAADSALDEVFARCSPEAAVLQVLMPASRAIGEAWADGRCSVAGEHLVSSRIRDRLAAMLRFADLGADAPGGGAIVACFPDEAHENGALATAFRLARRGYAVTYLGASLPWPDLLGAIARRRPVEVFLSVGQPTRFVAARADLIATVRAGAPARFWIGGRGAPVADPELGGLGAIVGPTLELPSPVEVWARSPRRDRS